MEVEKIETAAERNRDKIRGETYITAAVPNVFLEPGSSPYNL